MDFSLFYLPPIGLLNPTSMWKFLLCIIIFYFVMLGYLLEAFSFLMRDKKSRSGGKERLGATSRSESRGN